MKADDIEECVNEVERRIRAELPLMRKIFIEVDAQGDGRGIENARNAWARRMKKAAADFGPAEASS